MTEECFSSGCLIENQYIPIQVVLELQEPPEIINRDSIHSYSVCTTAPRVPSPNHSFNLAPSISYSGGEGGGRRGGPPPKLNKSSDY